MRTPRPLPYRLAVLFALAATACGDPGDGLVEALDRDDGAEVHASLSSADRERFAADLPLVADWAPSMRDEIRREYGLSADPAAPPRAWFAAMLSAARRRAEVSRYVSRGSNAVDPGSAWRLSAAALVLFVAALGARAVALRRAGRRVPASLWVTFALLTTAAALFPLRVRRELADQRSHGAVLRVVVEHEDGAVRTAELDLAWDDEGGRWTLGASPARRSADPLARLDGLSQLGRLGLEVEPRALYRELLSRPAELRGGRESR